MIVAERDILKISVEPEDSWIIEAREDTRVLKVHYHGEGVAEHLRKIDGLEGDSDYNIRKRYAISNKWLLEGLLRPFDNIFSAKGKTIDIDIPSESVRAAFGKTLEDVKGGLGISEYLKQVWKDNFIVDPNGLLFLEVKKNGRKGYLTQKGINSIRKMKLHGVTPEYVMFEADVTIDEKERGGESQKESGYALHWFVDDAYYYRVKVWSDTEKQSQVIEKIPNSFGYVPAIVNSDIIDTNRGIKISPIQKQVELLDKYLRNNSVHEVFLAKHGYPVFWAYGNVKSDCPTCSGTGNILDDEGMSRGLCSRCKGGGSVYKKDVTDAIILNPPKTKDSPTIAPNVAGYNGPDGSVSEDQRKEEDWTKNNIYFSLWGTTREVASNETATGRFIDIQPVNNRLNDFGDTVDKIGSEILKMFAHLNAPSSFKGGSYSVGRRFLIETPDQIWKKYIGAKKDGSSELILNQLLVQYYETEYQTNDLLRDYYIKISMLDPFPHSTLSEALALNIPEEHKQDKLYLPKYLSTKTMVEIIDRDIEDLRKDMRGYIVNLPTQKENS
jgi:hypothetical protein